MTRDEFISAIKSRGAQLAPGVSASDIAACNMRLQSIGSAMLPTVFIDLYGNIGAIILDTGYIFGPNAVTRGAHYPVPGIADINTEIAGASALGHKTVFGRNDMFWFAFDVTGACYMLDNLGLRVLRRYDDAYHAMYDCLIAGQV